MKQKDDNSVNRKSVTDKEFNDGPEYLQKYQPVAPHLIRKVKQCASSGMAQATGIHELLLWEVFVPPRNGAPFVFCCTWAFFLNLIGKDFNLIL